MSGGGASEAVPVAGDREEPGQSAPERFELRSHDAVGPRLAELLRLFPEARTEGGRVDFERLRLALGDAVDAGRERYGLTWPGKAECFRTMQAPSHATLLPMPEESVHWDETRNLVIEGDNLEVLKLLQKSYLGKVKLIFIDPPYNTGKDFIYPDHYAEGLRTYLEYTGQVDAQGKRFSTNVDSDGRFHSKWLNMMFPRLWLARHLLREDGVIFITIDDHEVENLRRLCDEVFGEENFLGCVTWQKKYAPANDKADFSATHDYVVAYARDRPMTPEGRVQSVLARVERSESMDAAYANPDDDPRGPWKPGDYTCNKSAEERPNLYYSIRQPNTGEEIWPRRTRVWAYGPEYHEKNVREGRVWWGVDGTNRVPAYKRFLSEVGGVVSDTVWTWDRVGHTDEAKKELKALFEEAASVFDTPKPLRLMMKILSLATSSTEEDVVLDFFAGSGTSAHAVLLKNREDGGNRRFVLVQLPEPTGRGDHPTIAHITRERVRRALAQIAKEPAGASPLDLGFRAFRLAESNFQAWDPHAARDAQTLQTRLAQHVHHVRKGRTQEDVLHEILLKSGHPPSTRVEALALPGGRAYRVEGGGLVVCLERSLKPDLVEAIAQLRPERVVMLDEGFEGDDVRKANAAQAFRDAGVTSFRTV